MTLEIPADTVPRAPKLLHLSYQLGAVAPSARRRCARRGWAGGHRRGADVREVQHGGHLTRRLPSSLLELHYYQWQKMLTGSLEYPINEDTELFSV